MAVDKTYGPSDPPNVQSTYFALLEFRVSNIKATVNIFTHSIICSYDPQFSLKCDNNRMETRWKLDL